MSAHELYGCACYVCRAWRSAMRSRDERIAALELYVEELEEEVRIRDEA
jgi:hypothetical protein